jgi:hypothetical protein
MQNKMKQLQQFRNYAFTFAALAMSVARGAGAEYHVSVSGNDANAGSVISPFKTISKAGSQAQPGDVITVHEGVYRERINPPHGGISDEKRIVYQAAPGEQVVIKGSERITDWKQVDDATWMTTLPNRFFGGFNPYGDLIHGDWYEAKRPYHTGAVYLNGHWLKEAARKNHVLKTATEDGSEKSRLELMNLRQLVGGGKNGQTLLASKHQSSSDSVQTMNLPDGLTCVGRLKDGAVLVYEMDFGEEAKDLTIYAASPVEGGIVEIRKGDAGGELLGTFDVALTAEWTSFQPYRANLTGVLNGKNTIALVFKARPQKLQNDSDTAQWFAEVGQESTTIWAQFKGVDPNKELVEINVRQSVFYPEQPGINYITVRGFTLEQAAAPWAPPTAEQIGLLGTHWSKGWLIEDNTIRYSTCSGVTLGKHGDEFDNTLNYNRSIRVALQRGWGRKNIGSHIVRNNHIYNCGQGGIIGSLGCSFSTITGNEIHDIRQHHEYGGCETAGIKLHGAVDAVISKNHVYRCAHWGGIWIDWMGQGARLTGNLLHDNSNDIMLEMNHGPMLIDNNILLSNGGVLDASGGGAYVHNLIKGAISIWSDLTKRQTPIFMPHTTDVKIAKGLNEKFGAMGGAGARFSDPVGNTEQDIVYQTVRYGTEGYRLDVPNGTYTVTLKFNEPFFEKPGSRRFGVSVQGKPVVEALDLVAKVGKNVAFDVVTKDVCVADGVLNIGFIRDLGDPCIAGIEVIGTRDAAKPVDLRINCGGDAWETYKADFAILTDEARVALLDRWGGVGFTVDQDDDRFLNNLFVKAKALSAYDAHKLKITAAGNVFLAGAKPSEQDKNPVIAEAFDPGLKLVEKSDGWWLELNVDPAWQEKVARDVVTTELLGQAKVSNATFENPDGTPYRIDTDYFGNKRPENNPYPGPFTLTGEKEIKVKVWRKIEKNSK